MSDEEYKDSAPTKKERERRVARLASRDSAWDMVSAIVGDMSVREIASNPMRLRPRILKQAEERGVNPTTVYRSLHIYLTSGGVRSSLIPNTQLRGAPGREKTHATKLGRKSRLEKAGDVKGACFILTPQAKQRLANGYAIRKKSKTVEDAYLLTCAVYWSTLKSDGTPKLLPPNERPTRTMFKYWGRKLNNTESRKNRIGSDAWTSNITAGSTQDQVCAVGQMAMIDSTSSDVYLTSMMSRLKKLPPMHRTIVKEQRSTAIIGFYVGWEAPSSSTALQAILCSAESKVELCARFGISIKEGEGILSLLCKLYLADNGEMKSKYVTDAEKEFRFGVEYVKAYSGQSKSDVENQHHTDHKRLDHKLPGTTKGKQRERGEVHPANEALWNYFEYMHEFLLMVIEYNNEEVKHLAPTAMLKEGVAPTRNNILKWMMDRNMRADIPCNVDQLRAYTLPSTKAVMTKTGIRLLMPDGIRHVPELRFYAPELQQSHFFADSVKSGGSVEIKVKHKEDDLGHVWFALPTGLARIPNVSSDDEFVREATMADHIQWAELEDLRKDKGKAEEDQVKLDTITRREGTTLRAKKEAEEELAVLPKKPSKKEFRSELRKNRDEEMTALRSQSPESTEAHEETTVAVPEVEYAEASVDAMDAFMQEFA